MPVEPLPSPVEPASIGRPFEVGGVLPQSVADAALAEAVGVAPPQSKKGKKPEKPRRDKAPPPDDDLDPDKRMNRKILIAGIAALVLGLGIAALVLLGRVNSDRYVLACTTKQAVAEQGRSFPPWGEKPLYGAQWKPIALPPNAQCKEEEVADRAKLELKFLDLLLERASAALTTHDFADTIASGQGASLDTISGQLEQALLLSRAPERGDQRKQVERLLGDVQYWRASLRLRDAGTALTDAAKQFDAAALQRPMHVSDAGAWAELLRRVSDELHAGPTGVPTTFPPAPTGDSHPAAPQGTALPVEPEPAGSGAPASPPDAGLPTGGVLL